MTTYLLIYRADPHRAASMPDPKADSTAGAQSMWEMWVAHMGDALVSPGAPTSPLSPGADPTIDGYSLVRLRVTTRSLPCWANIRSSAWAARSTCTKYSRRLWHRQGRRH